MSEPKWTPGPWNAIDCGTGWVVGPREADSDDYIADVHLHTHGISDESAEANANLIAAAPELYEALEFLLPWAEDGAEEGLHHHRNTDEGRRRCKEALLKCNEARYALARARGETTPK